MEKSPYISHSVLGDLLGGVSRATIWNLRKRDDFPKPRRIGRKLVFKRDEVIDWVEGQAA